MKISLWIWTVFLVVALLAAPIVSAENIPAASQDNTSGYKVRPSIGNASGVSPLTVTDSIKQGETKRHQFNIGSGVRWLEVNLDWTSSSDSLTLTIYTPGWVKVGTYHDADDGVIDGKIHIDIVPNSGYVQQGVWTLDVYGERVVTQRTYNLNVYQHY